MGEFANLDLKERDFSFQEKCDVFFFLPEKFREAVLTESLEGFFDRRGNFVVDFFEGVIFQIFFGEKFEFWIFEIWIVT